MWFIACFHHETVNSTKDFELFTAVQLEEGLAHSRCSLKFVEGLNDGSDDPCGSDLVLDTLHILSHFADEETEAQKVRVTCLLLPIQC